MVIKATRSVKHKYNFTRRNICDNYKDRHKNFQWSIFMRYMFQRKYNPLRLPFRALVLDSSIRRSTTNLIDNGVQKDNITLVEKDDLTYKCHQRAGINVHKGDIREYVQSTKEKFDTFYLDTENSASYGFMLLNDVLKYELIENEAVILLNFTKRDKRNMDYRKMFKRLKCISTNYQKVLDRICEMNPKYNVQVSYDNEYHRGRGGMFYMIFKVLKNHHYEH